MKGVILAGGTGSRLFPSTKVINKHLLPVYDRPMIYYPIDTLKRSGIREMLIITSADNVGDFMELLGSGQDQNLDFTYRIQDGAAGIADALSLAEAFSRGDSVAVILADNIFSDEFSTDVLSFRQGAQIFVKKVSDPSRFGVAEIRDDGTIRSIEEKPSFPKSDLAATGLYLYDQEVFSLIRELNPSARGELEITDLNNLYLKKRLLRATVISGSWVDAGTHKSLLDAGKIAYQNFDSNGVGIDDAEKTMNKISSPSLVTIGVVVYNDEQYISSFAHSIQSQDYKNIKIIFFDNHSSDDSVKLIRKHLPSATIITSKKNIGFGAGHNNIIRQAPGDFYACINIDMIFEPSYISSLIKTITKNPVYGSVGGKIKQWDFKSFIKKDENQGKTNFIDSVGIRITPSHNFEDIGQGMVDYGEFDKTKLVFGISGAAVMYRKSALDDIIFQPSDGSPSQYFDELLFLYKEDVDLSYRLQWSGWKSVYTPDAVCFHDRTTGSFGNRIFSIIKNRRQKNSFVNRQSYLNHNILLAKNFSKNFSRTTRWSTKWENFKKTLYLFFFEPRTFSQWFRYWRLRKEIRIRRESMVRRVDQKEIEILMKG